MNTNLSLRFSLLILTAGLVGVPFPPAIGQTAQDEMEVVHSVIKADRHAVVADTLQLTEAESQAFWPLYHRYRVEMDKAGDGLMKLVLEYAKYYPAVPEDRARKMLKELGDLEKKHAATRASYLKKIGKVLPATKTLRFAQVESRLDLAVRLGLAANIPLVPATK
jgi:hypothetical protein